YGVWKQRFGGEPDVIGRNLTINGRQRSVIGVMPRGFEYPTLAAMWAPIALDGENRARRDFHRYRVIARLKNGVSVRQARAEFKTIGAHLAQAYPDFNQDESVIVNP